MKFISPLGAGTEFAKKLWGANLVACPFHDVTMFTQP